VLAAAAGHCFRGFGCSFLLDQISSKDHEHNSRMHHAGRRERMSDTMKTAAEEWIVLSREMEPINAS
jgi:hypothetical protein